MKTINHVILFVFLLLLGSCTSISKFSISPITPAAEGTVKITHDKNKNFLIDVNVKYLADATRLTPPSNVYVVWMANDRGISINLGMLVSNSKNNASLRAVTSSKPFQIFVTAENVGDTDSPGNQEIFHTSYLTIK